MLKPSFRFFIIPLGAVATLASLSSQNIAPRAQRDAGSMLVREQVVDCSNKSAAEVCVISGDARLTSSRRPGFLTIKFFNLPIQPPKQPPTTRPGCPPAGSLCVWDSFS